jgi:hypothetical protein
MKNSKRNYLRYNDVFLSRGNPNNRNCNDSIQHERSRNNSYNGGPAGKFSSSNGDENEFLHEERFDDWEADDEDLYGSVNSAQEQRLDRHNREYFSNDNSIIDDRMIRYQKRQLPPLHRYNSASKNNYSVQRQMYWDEDEEEYEYSRRKKQYPSFRVLWRKFIVTFASILSLICITWMSYDWNRDQKVSEVGQVPVIIEPEQSSFKVLPSQPGGAEISHKDKTVYSRMHPGSSNLDIEERLLPPQEEPIDISRKKMDTKSENSGIEECYIIDDKTYYIKISAGKSRAILENEVKLLKKKYAQILNDISCSVKKVSNSRGEQKHAILVGSFDSQDRALEIAKELGGQCYIVSVRE